MSSVLLGVMAVALLCVVGALWLWQRAALTQQRMTTQRFVDSRLAGASGVSGQASGPGGTHALGAGGASGGQGGADGSRDSRGHAMAASGALAGGRTAADGRRVSGGASGQASTPGEVRNGEHGIAHDLAIRLRPLIERANRTVHRAGMLDIGRFYAMTLLILTGVVVVVGIEVNFIASGALLVFLLIGLRLWLWHRATRQQHRIVTQLPEFLDGVVRMITIGNSVPAAFQAAVPSVDLPLRNCLERASRMMRAGVELDKALNNLAELYVVEEFTLIASVVRLSVRYGGRADQVLDRMSAFMRDREMAQRELSALSAETRLSAWILGLLPIAVGTFIVFSNPQYFIGMWFDPTGRHIFYGAFGLQLVGIFFLYRLAKL